MGVDFPKFPRFHVVNFPGCTIKDIPSLKLTASLPLRIPMVGVDEMSRLGGQKPIFQWLICCWSQGPVNIQKILGTLNNHIFNGDFNWMITFTWEMVGNHHFHPFKTGSSEFQVQINSDKQHGFMEAFGADEGHQKYGKF